MQSWFRFAMLVATSLVAGCVEGSDESAPDVDDELEDVAEATDEIRNGQAAFTSAPEVVSLRMNEVSGPISQCSGITLSNRYIVTAAHCVERFTSFKAPRAPTFQPHREGTIPQLEVRVTHGTASDQIGLTAFFGTASVVIPNFWNNDGDPDDDIALLRTDDVVSPSFRARLIDGVESPHEDHFVTGWRPLDESDPLGRQKTRGRMDFGAWNSWEGLKLNTGDNGVVPINGDSGGGASIARTTIQNVSIDLYDGVLAERVTGGFWPGVMSARLYDKISWIESTGSVMLGSPIDFHHFSTLPTTLHPTAVPYVRIGSTP